MIEPIIIDGKTIGCPCYIDRPLHRYDKGCLIQSQAFKQQQTEEKPILRCDEIKNCPIKENYNELQRKIKQNDELIEVVQKRNEEIKNLNYTLYEDRELTTDLVKANLKISKLERTLSSVTNRFKYDWQNKKAECEELKGQINKIKDYVKHNMQDVDCDNWFERFIYTFEDWKKSLQDDTNRYKQALDEIEKILRDAHRFNTYCEDDRTQTDVRVFNNERILTVLDIISKAKGEE